MQVTVADSQSALRISRSSVVRLVTAFLAHAKCQTDAIAIYLVGPRKISLLHDKYFNDPTVTDCITFPIDPPWEKTVGPTCLGEIFVCPKIALDYASKHKIDAYEEVSLYVVHGLLHLLGYDDQTPADKRKMRQAEARYLNFLRKQKLLLSKDRK